MARPIKDTPVLKGKAAVHFLKEVRANESKKVSASEVKKAVADYKALKGKFKNFL